MLVRSSQARSMDKKGRSIGRRGGDTKLGKDKSLGMSRPLARGRFHRRGGGGRTRTRTRAGRQETSAVPVFSNFEAFHILTPDTIILIKLTCRSRKVESIRSIRSLHSSCHVLTSKSKWVGDPDSRGWYFYIWNRLPWRAMAMATPWNRLARVQEEVRAGSKIR